MMGSIPPGLANVIAIAGGNLHNQASHCVR
jgi:hypothetical protein